MFNDCARIKSSNSQAESEKCFFGSVLDSGQRRQPAGGENVIVGGRSAVIVYRRSDVIVVGKTAVDVGRRRDVLVFVIRVRD